MEMFGEKIGRRYIRPEARHLYHSRRSSRQQLPAESLRAGTGSGDGGGLLRANF